MFSIIDILKTKVDTKLEKFSHICLISTEKLVKMHKNNKFTVIGLNSGKIRYNNKFINTHAEIKALKNLMHKMRKYNVKKININILVLRFTCDGNTNNSAPCHHCCMELNKYKNLGININFIYYSDSNNNIRVLKFDEYLLEEKYVTKGWSNLKLYKKN